MSIFKWLFGDGNTPARINGKRARELINEGASLIDVRSAGEFQGGHLDEARNIPVDQIAQRVGEIPQGPVVLYCRSGMRSARAAKALRNTGREDVYDLGPMSAW